jgi:hypothetical protein
MNNEAEKAKKPIFPMFPTHTLLEAKRALIYARLPENASVRDEIEARIFARYPELKAWR